MRRWSLLGLISLALMTATIKALIFRHKIETAVLVLPVATMIAFAQLRGSMPNAPAGFGTSLSCRFVHPLALTRELVFEKVPI